MSDSVPADGMLLEIDDVVIRFAGNAAVDGVSLSVHAHQRVGLIGPNGAGKSTLVNCICGAVTPSSGRVRFRGQDLHRVAPHRRARLGIARTFQNLELFPSMTVLDNVVTALDAPGGGRPRGSAQARRRQARQALARFDIAGHADAPVSTLPYGLRKLVELSRALVGDPSLVVLDEPAAGLDTGEKEQVADALRGVLDQQGCAVLLIEHDMPTVQGLCEHVHVLDAGTQIAEGSFAQVASDPAVIDAYLGG
jgi:branched-chain amino acid transport system ATP-binding protein